PMIRFKSDPFLTGLILVTVISVTGEGCWFWRLRGEAARAGALLMQTVREREALARQLPALTEENERAISGELIAAAGQLSGIETESAHAVERAGGAASVTPTEAYFEIAGFVE